MRTRRANWALAFVAVAALLGCQQTAGLGQSSREPAPQPAEAGRPSVKRFPSSAPDSPPTLEGPIDFEVPKTIPRIVEPQAPELAEPRAFEREAVDLPSHPPERCKQPVEDLSCYCLVDPSMPRCSGASGVVPAQ
jgi:hypothetical protein